MKYLSDIKYDYNSAISWLGEGVNAVQKGVNEQWQRPFQYFLSALLIYITRNVHPPHRKKSRTITVIFLVNSRWNAAIFNYSRWNFSLSPWIIARLQLFIVNSQKNHGDFSWFFFLCPSLSQDLPDPLVNVMLHNILYLQSFPPIIYTIPHERVYEIERHWNRDIFAVCLLYYNFLMIHNVFI